MIGEGEEERDERDELARGREGEEMSSGRVKVEGDDGDNETIGEI